MRFIYCGELAETHCNGAQAIGLSELSIQHSCKMLRLGTVHDQPPLVIAAVATIRAFALPIPLLLSQLDVTDVTHMANIKLGTPLYTLPQPLFPQLWQKRLQLIQYDPDWL